MDEFDKWVAKLILNLDEGNIREALYCSDMALYTAEDPRKEPPKEKLARLYMLRGKLLDITGNPDEARTCYDVAAGMMEHANGPIV